MTDFLQAWPEISSRLETATRLCVLADFDGTLAPITGHPDEAVLAPAVRARLESLGRNRRVTFGLVSGRALADLVARVGIPGMWYVGNHGFEIRRPSGEEHRFYTPDDVAEIERVGGEIREATAALPGVVLEHKGPILAVHYRQVEPGRIPEVERCFLRAIQGHLRQVMVHRGRMVLEARLRMSCNKGMAVRFIRRELPLGTLPIYFGDDLTDHDAFRELRPIGLTVEVGGTDSSLAEFTLPGPEGVAEALDRIDAEMSQRATTFRGVRRPRKGK